jgi:hypothetical protein
MADRRATQATTNERDAGALLDALNFRFISGEDKRCADQLFLFQYGQSLT